MSKFIRVTDMDDGIEMLIPTSSITLISNFCTKGSRIIYADNSFNAKEPLEQIEAQLLRDDFAMRSMQAIQNAITIPDGTFDFDQAAYDSVVAECAYRMADAMLKERSK